MRRHTQQLQSVHHHKVHNTLRQPDWQEVVDHLERSVLTTLGKRVNDEHVYRWATRPLYQPTETNLLSHTQVQIHTNECKLCVNLCGSNVCIE